MIIGTGIDLVEVRRIKEALLPGSGYSCPIRQTGRNHKDRFLKRVFTPEEISYAKSRGKTKPASPAGGQGGAEHLAARFAAKEAFLKAIQTGWGTKYSPLWREIEVKTRVNGQPYLVLSGKAHRIRNKLKVKHTHLSLTHTRDYALALVVLER